MTGIFEHLAAFDDGEAASRRKAAAIARKRVQDRFGAFLSNSANEQDFNARLDLIRNDITAAIADVVAEYGGDAEKIAQAVTSDWQGLQRNEKGQWTSPSQLDNAEAPANESLDSDLADAPSAVGEGVLANAEPFRTAGPTTGLGGPTPPTTDKSKGRPGLPSEAKPDSTTKVTDGVTHDGERKTPKADYKNGDPGDLGAKSESLPDEDENAGFQSGGEEHGDHTDTWSGMKGQADPVTSATDPDKNPITEILENQWLNQNQVQAALADFERTAMTDPNCPCNGNCSGGCGK